MSNLPNPFQFAAPQAVEKAAAYQPIAPVAGAAAALPVVRAGLKTIRGPFEVKIVIKRQRGDLDNRAKGILDWLQSRAVVVDDKFCERLVMEWGEAPAGCRVTVRPFI